MFGYIRPAFWRLSREENERFHSAYCGLCHTLGREYGFAARFLLNYDFTFLAILLLSGETDVSCSRKRCAIHPCRGCTAIGASSALDAAAARSVVLFWWQLRDHVLDHGFVRGMKYRAAMLFIRRAYRKARSAAPDFDKSAERHLRELGRKEAERCASLDEAAQPFAALLSEIAGCERSEARRRIFSQLFYHLGRWIYLIDAADDFKADAKSGCYNPLRFRYGIEGDELPDAVKQALGETLDASIRQMSAAYALLDAGCWAAVLDSIFYDSFYGIGNAVLSGAYRKPSRIKRTEEGYERSV